MNTERKSKSSSYTQDEIKTELEEAKQAGGAVVKGVAPIDAITTTLDACQKLDIMNLEETARFLRISKSKLYNHVKYRYIPFLRLGGKIVFVRSLLENWIIRQTVKPDAIFSQTASRKFGVSA